MAMLQRLRFSLFLYAILFAAGAAAATFGTVVTLPGGASDIVLDEARGNLYLVNPGASRIDVYSISRRTFLTGIRTAATPVSAALARDGRALYVTCYDGSSLDVIDLTIATPRVTRSVNLPAKPEGVAVGGDGRVLITTIGTGAGNQTNTLLVFDPRAVGDAALTNVVIPVPPPTPPQLPPPSGRIFLAFRSRLATTRDGNHIIGVNNANATSRGVFVYEVASATVLRSRTVAGLSSVLAVSPDGSKFMAGLSLFDTETLAILAQENAANAPFTFPGGAAGNFNTQQNQGGSVFSPDGATLYAAFNIAPVQSPPARANISRLLVNDPDNLLITLGLQLPENLVGNMVMSSDGRNIYALSESGFMILPISTINQNPIAMPQSPVVLLANDQCGVQASKRIAAVDVLNIGRGNVRATAMLLPAQQGGVVPGLGGIGGPGGGAPGGAIIIVLPPIFNPGAGGAAPGGFPQQGFGPAPGGNQGAAVQTSPQVLSQPSGTGTRISFAFNALAGRAPGTVAPHDFLIQSADAINIPSNVRVYQNFRNAESRGDVMPVQLGASINEGLVDMVTDSVRQRLYISNSGMNRVEVFDMRQKRFLNPIKVGQLPRSLALGIDGNTLYAANSGGESISIVDLDRGVITGRIKFPAIPFNANFPVVTPSLIATGLRGPQLIMSDGTLWKVVGDQAIPRDLNSDVFGTARTIPAPRTMAATPNGERILLMAGNGNAYLYDALTDQFIVGRTIFSAPIQGYYGPVAAGPRGQYYVANGTVLNESLTPVTAPPTTGAVGGGLPGVGLPGGGGGTVGIPGTLPGGIPERGGVTVPTPTVSVPVAAVASAGAQNFLRFAQPIRANQNQLPTTPPSVDLVDIATGNTLRSFSALEGPLSAQTGNQRVNVNGRTMALDASGTTAYLLTTSGLSIIPLDPVNAQNRPQISQNGVVNTASYLPTVAPGALAAIFGQNLATDGARSPGAPLPTTLGGACVTLNTSPVPLLLTSAGQINVQIPPELAAGRYTLMVRSFDRQVASQNYALTVAKAAPAVFVDPNGQAAIFHLDGRRVTKDRPAKRDERLIIYATGMGATKGGRVSAGNPAPASPLAVTDKVAVYFGDPRYREAEMIVEWSGLVPGEVGLNQIVVRVPGAHQRGDKLPVTLKVLGVTSPTTGPAVPLVAVD